MSSSTALLPQLFPLHTKPQQSACALCAVQYNAHKQTTLHNAMQNQCTVSTKKHNDHNVQSASCTLLICIKSACRHCSSTLHKLHNIMNLQLQLYTAQQHNRHWIVNTNSRFALQQGITAARPNSQNHNSQPLHLSSTVLQHQHEFNTANNLMVLSSYRYTTYYISYSISHILYSFKCLMKESVSEQCWC